MTKISGHTFKDKRIAGRVHHVATINDKFIMISFVEADSCGNKLGWYFDTDRDTSRRFGQYFETAEAALEAALKF